MTHNTKTSLLSLPWPLLLVFGGVVLVTLGFLIHSIRSADGGEQILLLLLMVCPAFLLAATDSSRLLPYTICIWAFSPEVRRLYDWSTDSYRPVTVLSLAPLLCMLAFLIPISRSRTRLPAPLRLTLSFFALCFAYAGVVGVALNGLMALYELASFCLPMLLIPYFALRPISLPERDGWLASFSTIAVLVALYGWFQYLTAPAWDMFWMMESKMNTSMGSPKPMEFRLFSTLNSTGPAAIFFAYALLVMFIHRRWRGVFGLTGIFIVLSALAVTLVRAGWIVLLVMIVAYLITAERQNRVRAIVSLIVIVLLLVVVFPAMPGADKVLARTETFSNLQEDTSYNARFGLIPVVISTVTENPAGRGMGSTGFGAKIVSKDTGPGAGFDNGFGALFMTFGLPFGCLFFFAYLKFTGIVWKMQTTRVNISIFARLGFSVLIGSLVSLIFVNTLVGITGFLSWLFSCLCFCLLKPTGIRKPSIS